VRARISLVIVEGFQVQKRAGGIRVWEMGMMGWGIGGGGGEGGGGGGGGGEGGGYD